jgi:hypothetical protein
MILTKVLRDIIYINFSTLGLLESYLSVATLLIYYGIKISLNSIVQRLL